MFVKNIMKSNYFYDVGYIRISYGTVRTFLIGYIPNLSYIICLITNILVHYGLPSIFNAIQILLIAVVSWLNVISSMH